MVATFLILTVLGHAPDVPPVRVWLGSGSPVAPGDRVRVYVQTTSDGYVVVLHRRPDGGVQVLFPADPATDPFTRAGTYEIRTTRDAPALSAAAQGSGVVLAALSSEPFRLGEFVSGRAWNAAALALSWVGSDAEAALTDIVQRMLGDGAFNYDLVMYTVAAPRTYALDDTSAATPTPTAAECMECSSAQLPPLVIEAPILIAFPRVHHRPPLHGPESATGHRSTVPSPRSRRQRPPSRCTGGVASRRSSPRQRHHARCLLSSSCSDACGRESRPMRAPSPPRRSRRAGRPPSRARCHEW